MQKDTFIVQKEKEEGGGAQSSKDDFFGRVWEESWTYIKTVVDVVREPVLILDKELKVMAANEPFYDLFRVEAEDTIGKNVYKLGNGQWDIVALRKLLEDILPQHTFFKGFEVVHKFPLIGEKVMILNARQIRSRMAKGDSSSELCPPIILLAMEDVTEMMVVAKKIASHTHELETALNDRTSKLEDQIEKLQKSFVSFQKKL
jgi:PAS domain-containing protein